MVQEAAEILVKAKADLKNAEASLDSFNNKTNKAAKSADLTNAAMGKLSDTMSMLGGDIKETIAQGFDTLSKKIDEQTKGFDRLTSSVKKAKTEYKALNDTQKQTSKIADSMTGVDTKTAAGMNRFYGANIVAQLQDIIVTAQMGMPITRIMMQQGTQLQYVMVQGALSMKSFMQAIKACFTPMSLLAFAITGLIAGFVKLVDWASIGKTVLSALGSIFTWIGDKTSSLNISALGQRFKDLAGDIEQAKEEAEGFYWVVKGFEEFDKKLQDREFQLTLEGKTDVEKAKLTALRELDGVANKLVEEKKGKATLDELNDIQLTLGIYKDRVNKVIEKEFENKKASEAAAEAKKKEKEALENAAKAAKKDADAIERLNEAWNRLQTSSQDKINNLVMQQGLIGAGTYEKTYIETLNDTIRQAQSSGLDLYSNGGNGKTIYDTLNENAKATAALTEENERLNASYEFSKSTVKGFFSDMRQGLRDGQSAWETFGNAVSNVLDKILDKIMDIGVDALFGAGRSYFGTSAMGGYGLFGGLGAGTGSTGIGGLQVGQTSGNLTYLGNIAMNANGGVYSNGIYNSPTLFKFGKGGKFGLMGEAGPEAVMPLTRGPDGSLGVRAENSSASPVVVNVINNSNAQAKVEQRQTSQGMEIDVMIDQLVAEKMNQPGTSSNNALRAFSNQKLIAR